MQDTSSEAAVVVERRQLGGLTDLVVSLRDAAEARGWSPRYAGKVLAARGRGSVEFPEDTYKSFPPAFKIGGQWFVERVVFERFFVDLVRSKRS